MYNLGFLAIVEGRYDEARSSSQQALAIFRETGDRWGEADALHSLGQVAATGDDSAGALDLYEQSLAIARLIGHRRAEAMAMQSLGNLHSDDEDFVRAGIAYEKALALARELDLPGCALECQAGLAVVAVSRGALDLGGALVGEVLANLTDSALAQASEPFRVYLSCYQVLRACHDDRAENLLVTAYERLREQGARSADDASRLAFLQNVPSHRALAQEAGGGLLPAAGAGRADLPAGS